MKLNPAALSPASEIFVYALARWDTRRESYYSFQVSGALCYNFRKRMLTLCSLFFHRDAQDWSIVTDSILSTRILESMLKNVAALYFGSEMESAKGIEFYLRTQKRRLQKWLLIGMH